MNKFLKNAALVATVAGLALTAAPAFASDPVTKSATASVRLYDPLELTNVSDLDFGTIYRSSTYNAGTAVSVSIDANNAVDCTASAELTCSGTPSAGIFKMAADNQSTVTLTLDGADYSEVGGVSYLTLKGNNDVTKTLTAKIKLESGDLLNPVSQPNAAAQPGLYEIAGNGPDDGSAADDQMIYVTADLLVKTSANAPDDKYVANYQLTADYK